MLTKEQFYLTPEVEQYVLQNPEIHLFTLEMKEGENSILDFATYELENYTRLEFSIALMECKQEFLIHSYYFLLNQIQHYQKQGIQDNIANEIAENDLIKKYKNLNIKLIQKSNLLAS